ncbi:hypothetical protein [Actinoplanes sp. NBRC 103695]|uniref:hypothetical protein n=1 Tax=Actinoplanes sp. NBRC 103695 TaxID=3032202 RepID=UPI00249F9CD4|nr:hypothetical protein [Actinoplanes sp. NBRC 103695]GLY99043.1 hypothetical protein Acsp02_62970 [Actinoplanes sp. NBRC 103695]
MSTYELSVRGRLADSLLDLIRNRFGEATAFPDGLVTTLNVGGLDPASERALLTLLWDTGHDVIAMRSTRAAKEPFRRP